MDQTTRFFPPALSRREFAGWLGATGVTLLAGCASCPPARRGRPATSLPGQADRSLAMAAQYLAGRQSADGAWRSEVYGFFKDGLTLTPHVLEGIAAVEKGGLRPAMEKGANYLARQVDTQGSLPADLELIYPTYTCADASRVVLLPEPTPARRNARVGWLRCLRRYQADESLGWHSEDPDYGGWGYAREPPRKTPTGAFSGPWDWSNLSATSYALDALRSADVPTDAPVFSRALSFVQRCQNFSEADGPRGAPEATSLRASDGGFFFGPSASIRNKAGASVGADGSTRFNSYGSMTCDGLRALQACGLPPGHPRIIAARRWLEQNFSVTHQPGQFVPPNEDLRGATYFYYVRSLSLALVQLARRRTQSPPCRIDWAKDLAAELINRQRPDGSWANGFTDGKEDDPLVATPFATAALSICRRSIN